MILANCPTKQLLEIQEEVRKEIARRFRLKNVAEKRNEYVLFRRSHKEASKEINNGIEDFISKGILEIPALYFLRHPNSRLRYLRSLIKQDWSPLFSAGSEEKCFYVYAHCDPRQEIFRGHADIGGPSPGLPFYIGKGTKERAYDFKRNQGHGIRLRELVKEGFSQDMVVHVFKRDMTEREALELEAKLIYFFGTIYEKEKLGTLLNLDESKRPFFCGFMDQHGNKLSNEEEVLISKRFMKKRKRKTDPLQDVEDKKNA